VHELSIVQSLIGPVTEAAQKAGARKVTILTLRVGDLSSIVEDALQFCYGFATEGTMLEKSKLVVHRVPVVIFCENCRLSRELPGIHSFRCPACNTPSADLRQGRELEIESMEIEVDDDDSNR
jgi:hydrogenase nickel incorporation protein HypA/HybF